MFSTSQLLIPLAVAIGLLLLLREFYCWYFKINEANRKLEQIRELLEAQNRFHEQDRRERSKVNAKVENSASYAALKSIPNPSVSTPTVEEDKVVKAGLISCPKCGLSQLTKRQVCYSCGAELIKE